MLFTGRKRSEFGMSEDDAGGNAGVGGYGFVAGIAGDDAGMGTADHAGDHQCRPAITIFAGKLVEAAGVVLNNRAGRDAMDETAAAKALVGHRAREGWRPGRDHFGTGMVERSSSLASFSKWS